MVTNILTNIRKMKILKIMNNQMLRDMIKALLISSKSTETAPNVILETNEKARNKIMELVKDAGYSTPSSDLASLDPNNRKQLNQMLSAVAEFGLPKSKHILSKVENFITLY
jgi:hypothetical protein